MNKTKTDLLVTVVCKEEIAWRRLKRSCLKLQKRIYRAFKIGNIKTGRRLQKTLLSSWSGKCIAIKKAIAEFKYSQLEWRSLAKIANLAVDLKFNNSNRRINNQDSQHLEERKIRKLQDRALQILASMALKPEWEAKKQYNQNYSCVSVVVCDCSRYSAVKAVLNAIGDRSQVLLQGKLLTTALSLSKSRSIETIKTFPKLSRKLKIWLKSEVILEKQVLARNSKYKPKLQIASLLAKMVFVEIQNKAITKFKDRSRKKAKLIIYQNYFVFCHPYKQIIYQWKNIFHECLREINIQNNSCNLSISNLLNRQNLKQINFDFLGFNFRQCRVSKHNCLKSDRKNQSRLKTIVTPTLDAKQKHFQELIKIIKRHQASPANILINRLNYQLERWVNYYSLFVDKKFFRQCDRLLLIKLWNWAKYRHPRKSSRFIWKKYWMKIGDRRSIFGVNLKNGFTSQLHSYVNLFTNKSTHIKRYVFEEPCEGKLSRTVL